MTWLSLWVKLNRLQYDLQDDPLLVALFPQSGDPAGDPGFDLFFELYSLNDQLATNLDHELLVENNHWSPLF